MYQIYNILIYKINSGPKINHNNYIKSPIENQLYRLIVNQRYPSTININLQHLMAIFGKITIQNKPINEHTRTRKPQLKAIKQYFNYIKEINLMELDQVFLGPVGTLTNNNWTEPVINNIEKCD